MLFSKVRPVSLLKRTRYLLLLAGCAYSNEAILGELEQRARAAPEPALQQAIDRDGAAPWMGAAQPVALPMLRGKVPAVMGRLNGVEMPFALDTGTSVVMLSAEAARAAGIYLPPGTAEPVIGPGHTGAFRPCAFSTLEIGADRFGPGIALVAVNDRPGRWMGLGTDRYAIVGCSILSHFRVTFDFRKAEARLLPTGRAAHASPLFTRIEVNGKPFLLLVDSGATAVFLEPWAALELGLITPGEAKRHEERAGRLSDAVFTSFTLDSVRVPGRVFRDVDGAAVDTFGDRMPQEGFRPGGLLGLRGFGDLVWTLDYGTRTLSLEP